MKLVTNKLGQPFVQLSPTVIYNLNTLEQVPPRTDFFTVKAVEEIRISKHNDNNFIKKAEKLFKVKKITKMYAMNYYLLDAQLKIFCQVTTNGVQLIGNYPIHYLKLLYRFINNSL